MDDPVILSALEFDPFGYLSDMTQKLQDKPLIIDEAQRTNVLPLAIKSIVDKNNRPGQFVLTGSSNIFTTYNVADSLAGRVRTLHLWPLTITEIKKQTPSRILDWGFSANPDLSELPGPDQLDRREYIDILLAERETKIWQSCFRSSGQYFVGYFLIGVNPVDVTPVRTWRC